MAHMRELHRKHLLAFSCCVVRVLVLCMREQLEMLLCAAKIACPS